MAFKMKGFPMMAGSSSMKQKYVKPIDYWYKVDGKNVTYDEYKKAWKEGIDNRRANLQTNDPDAFGIKAKHKKDREKIKKHTVLTEEQQSALKQELTADFMGSEGGGGKTPSQSDILKEKLSKKLVGQPGGWSGSSVPPV